jgi:hypothetical protein
MVVSETSELHKNAETEAVEVKTLAFSVDDYQ